MNRLKTAAIAAAALTGAATLGFSGVYAAQTNKLPGRMNNLVNAIAQKFNLNASDVQKVFDEQHQQDMAQRQADNLQRLKDRLAAAVKAGTLTQAQSDLILAKHQEWESFMNTLQDKTPDERQAAIQAKMDEVKQWAKDNNIPDQFMPMAGGKGERGFGMGMGISLEQAVKDGKLTQAQADLIKAKREELKNSFQDLKGKTQAERDAAIKAQTDALQQWAKDNNIPEQYVLGGPGMGMGRGMGRGMHGGGMFGQAYESQQ